MADWAAVFDVDGTMVDNRGHHEAAWLELGRRRGLPITTEFYRRRMHSRSNAEIARVLLGEDVAAETSKTMGDEKEAIYRETYRPVLREIAGLSALLAALAEAGVPCAAASNSPPVNVDMVIGALGIRDRFRCIVYGTEVKRGKPAPDLFLAAARRLGLAPARCLVLEDSISGFGAAEAAGTPYVAVTAGADPAELAHARQAVARVRDFTELNVSTMAQWVAARGGTH